MELSRQYARPWLLGTIQWMPLGFRSIPSKTLRSSSHRAGQLLEVKGTTPCLEAIAVKLGGNSLRDYRLRVYYVRVDDAGRLTVSVEEFLHVTAVDESCRSLRPGRLASGMEIVDGALIAAWFKKGSGTVAGTAEYRPKVGRVLRTTVPDPFLNHALIADDE